MKVFVKFAEKTMYAYARTEEGPVAIASQAFDESGIGKAKTRLIKKLYKENEEYDIERLLETWARLKAIRIPHFEAMADEICSNMRRALIPEETWDLAGVNRL